MLINLRNALMAGRRLPYDAEVEYLESTGTQWIDTGVIGNLDSVAEITAQWTGISGFAPLFGARNSYNSRGFAAYNGSDQGYLWCFSFDNTFNYDWARSNVLSNDGLTHNIRIGYNCRVDNWSATWSSAGQFTTSNTLLVFAWNQNGTITAGSYRVYSCKIWDNGVLVRDYIPVRRGTVGYLYDRVSGKLFGNAGTGDFVLGPDVVPVEYIESHGTEYINTGAVPTPLTKWDIDAQFTSSDYGQIMGRGGNPALNPRFAFGLDIQSSGHGLTWYCGMGDVNTWNGTFNTFRHTFSLDAPYKTFTIDTTSYSVPFSSIGDTTIMQLFARFVNGRVQNFCKAKIFKSSIIDNGLPVRSFRPVRIGTDATSWEGAAMDVLTRRIYRNAGTGAFSYGNDLKYPIPAE